MSTPTVSSQDRRFHRLRVQGVEAETADSRSVVLGVPPELQDTFRYRAGQFLTVRIPLANRTLLRCYSLCSSPAVDEPLRIAIKRVAGGVGSNWLCDHLQAGDTLEVMPPAGVFSPDATASDLVLMAAGSGITPVLSILRTVLLKGSGRVQLVYANRDERAVMFAQTLRTLSRTHPRRFSAIHWLDSVQGQPSAEQLGALLSPWPKAEAFVCGPAPFMNAAVTALASIGMADECIHVERFVSLADEPPQAVPPAAAADPAGLPQAMPATEPGGSSPASAAPPAALTVALGSQSHAVVAQAGQTVLDAALAAGLQPPYVCRSGLCGSCRCRVVSGSVHLAHNDALDERDLSQGWTLACQATATSPTLHVQFPG